MTHIIGYTPPPPYKGKEIGYSYGELGERTSITYPSGQRLLFDYDEYLRLSRLSCGDVDISYTYDTNSDLCQKHFSNGVSAHYAYGEAGLLENITHRDSQGVLDSFSFTYNELAQKVGITQMRRELPEVSGDYHYSYDVLSRLTSVTKDCQLLRSFEYDEFNNLTTLTEKGSITNNSFNLLNQLTSSKTEECLTEQSFDKRGNIREIVKNGTVMQSFNFGAHNRLEEAQDALGTLSRYLYNGLGVKVAETISCKLDPTKEIKYVVDLTKQFDNVLQIDDGTTAKDYLWDLGIVAEISDSTHTYLRDHLGSPLQFIGSDGQTAQSYAYSEFGADLTHNQNTLQPFGYTGYSFDKTANSYFAQARHYDPALACFISADIHWNTENMLYGDTNYFIPDVRAVKQSTNLYGYCLADPLRYVDKTGRFDELHARRVREWGGDRSEQGLGLPPDVIDEIINGNKEIDFPINTPAYWSAVNVSGFLTNPVINVSPVFPDNTGSPVANFVRGLTSGIVSVQIGGPGQAFHFNRQNDAGVVTALQNQGYIGVNSNVDTRLSLSNHYFWKSIENAGNPQMLGRALHPLQDFFAHGNIGIDSTTAAHRPGWLGGGYDSAQYDWADCTLTSVRLVGEENSNRVTSENLATGGMMYLWNFKSQ